MKIAAPVALLIALTSCSTPEVSPKIPTAPAATRNNRFDLTEARSQARSVLSSFFTVRARPHDAYGVKIEKQNKYLVSPAVNPQTQYVNAIGTAPLGMKDTGIDLTLNDGVYAGGALTFTFIAITHSIFYAYDENAGQRLWSRWRGQATLIYYHQQWLIAAFHDLRRDSGAGRGPGSIGKMMQ